MQSLWLLRRPWPGLLPRFREDIRGVVAAEFALSIPIILMLLMGLVEVGRIVYTQAALDFAAQEGTRYAIVRDGEVTTEEIEAYASSRMLGVVDDQMAVFAATAPVDPGTNTSLITIEVTFQYRPWFPLIPGFNLTADSSGFLAFPNGG
ncbi:MAG: TadE family protein [Rhodovibrionaceae bacterium]